MTTNAHLFEGKMYIKNINFAHDEHEANVCYFPLVPDPAGTEN